MINEGRINCPSELSMLRYDGNGRISRYYKTERASNLTQSQCVIEVVVRIAEKESLTLFLSNGISLPSDSAKLQKISGLDALSEQIILQR